MAHFESGRAVGLGASVPYPLAYTTFSQRQGLGQNGDTKNVGSRTNSGQRSVGVAIRRMPPATSVGGHAIALTTFYNSLLRLDTSTLPELYISAMA